MSSKVKFYQVNWKAIYDLPYILVYKSRNLSQNKILHRQFVLYAGNTLGEVINERKFIFQLPSESWRSSGER